MTARKRTAVAAALVGALVAGCSGSDTVDRRAPASPSVEAARPQPPQTPPAGASPVAGGCGDTTVYRGAPPGWNPRPAGFSDRPTGPYVLSRNGTAMGYLFGFPLRSPAVQEYSNKILWYVRLPREGHALSLRGHPIGATRPTVSYTVEADSGPGEIYPSIVEVPQAGCWRFTLSWGENHDEVELEFRAGPVP